jgi:hypothetical protein
VGVIVNTKLKRQYQNKKLSFSGRDAEESKEEWVKPIVIHFTYSKKGFHGSTRDSILKIASSGFLHPDELKKLKEQNTGSSKGKGKKKKAMKVKPVELLDDGYFGRLPIIRKNIEVTNHFIEEYTLLHFLTMHCGIQVKENLIKCCYLNFFLENRSNVTREWMD